MRLSYYYIIYSFGNLFMAYVIYKYMRIFYAECKVRSIYECLAYIGYFILITTAYIAIGIPLAVMGVNIALFFLLTLLYVGSIKKAAFSVAIIYFSLMCIETVIVVLTSHWDPDVLVPFSYTSSFGIIAIKLLSYTFVLVMHGFKNVKKEYPMPAVYWLSLIVVPIGTLIMLFIVFSKESVSDLLLVISIGSAFAINVITFYLYGRVSSLVITQINKKLENEQKAYYEHQIAMMKSTLDSMRTLRHDLKNKLSPLYELVNTGQSAEMIACLADLMDLCQINKEYSASGNSNFDSIINYKLQHAEKDKIRVVTDILIPVELSISAFDIATILGNLLDNALEAVVHEEERWIKIKVKYTKGRLIIEVSNSYDGIVKTESGRILSRKNDMKNHGMGLKSVEASLQKYDGVMQIAHDEKTFKTKLLLYIM